MLIPSPGGNPVSGKSGVSSSFLPEETNRNRITPEKMNRHQAVAEERERIPCLGAGEIAQEHIPFALGAEDIGSVVPAVDRVVNKVIACRSWKSSHECNLPT